MKFVNLLLFLTLLPSCVFGQDSDNQRLTLIKALSDYRAYLILKNPKGTHEVKSLLQKWNKIESENQKKKNFKKEIILKSNNNEISHLELIKKLKSYKGFAKLARKCTSEDVRIIKENSRLLDLILLGLLESEYPFKFNNNTSIFSELKEYNFLSTEKIAEVGVGEGAFSMMLLILNSDLKLFINELHKPFLEVLASTIERDLKIYNIEHINLIHGGPSSIGMEGFEIDKIFIRNSFHHFEDKNSMLKSIHSSLKKSGFLFVLEATSDLNKGRKKCNLAMKSKDILRTIESEGFRLLKQVQIGENTMMKFEWAKISN